MIYTYRISLKLIFTVILKKRSIQKVVFISDAPSMNTYSRIKIFFIKFFIRLPFENITFRIADFVDSQRSTLHFQVLEESRDHALRFANEEIENLGLLYYFPIWLTKNLTLHLSQIYYQSIYIAVREILLFNAIDRTDKDILYIEVDRCIKSYLCEQNFNGIVIKNRSEYYYFFIRDVFFFFFNSILVWLKILPLMSVKESYNYPSILTSHFDEIHFKDDIRNKLFWFLDPLFSTHKLFCLVDSKVYNTFYSNSIPKPSNIEIMKRVFMGFKSYSFLNRCLEEFFTFYFSILDYNLRNGNIYVKIILLNKILYFLQNLECAAHISKRLTSNLYVYEDGFHRDTHIFNSLAGNKSITTVNIQYSNLAVKTLPMLSNPSVLLAYSSFYSDLFALKKFKIGPKLIKFVGYSTQGNIEKIKIRAQLHRDTLNNQGVQFIIGFFDENVQEDSDIWAFKTRSEHLRDIHDLCIFILEHPKVGLLYKSQFIKNNPLIMFPNDPLILKAFKTKRISFPLEGSLNNRNLVSPAEIALASDICIGDLTGATASLEAKLIGTKSILVNSMKIGYKYRSLYFDTGVVYDNLEDALINLEYDLSNSIPDSVTNNWDNILKTLDLNSISQNVSKTLLHLHLNKMRFQALE